jgi:hypothetical protein
MSKLFDQVADGLLARLVPQVTAAAAHTGCEFSQFCYCSRGLAYRRFFYCGSGGRPGRVTACQPAGTC